MLVNSAQMRSETSHRTASTFEAAGGRWWDITFCFAILLFTIIYISFWPHDLTAFDEGLFLYEAKRILQGQIIYRDFFEIITPASLYAMALVFKIFGVSMETARVSMSVLHGMIAVAMYLICRRAGIRRSIAGLASMAHVAVCYPALSIASAHWVGTFVSLIAVLLAVRTSSSSPRNAFWLGAVLGLLVSVQQQKGAILALGGAFLVLADGWLFPVAGASTIVSLLAYSAGGAVILVPLLLALLWFAGFEPVYMALIHFPFVFYPRFHQHISWGYYVTFAPQLYVFPELIKYLPTAVPLAAYRVARRWWQEREQSNVRPLFVLTLFSSFTILSIAYNADYTHLAVTAPVWLLVVADTLESAVRRIARRGAPFHYAAAPLCAVLALVLVFRLVRNPEARRQDLSSLARDRFRPRRLHEQRQIVLVDTLHRLLEDSAVERDLLLSGLRFSLLAGRRFEPDAGTSSF